MLSAHGVGRRGLPRLAVATPLWIEFLSAGRHSARRIHEDLRRRPPIKAGTPTMGGVIIVVTAVLGYLMGHVGTSIVFTRSGVLVVARDRRLGTARLRRRLHRRPQRPQPRAQQARQVRRPAV